MRSALPFSIGAHALLLTGAILWATPHKPQNPLPPKALRVELSLLSPRPPAPAAMAVPRTEISPPKVPAMPPSQPKPKPAVQAVKPIAPQAVPVREAPPTPVVVASPVPDQGPAPSAAAPATTTVGGTGTGGAPGEAGVVKVSAAMLANKGNAVYVGTLFSWLEKYRQYPRRARLTNTEGTVMLRFRIDRDGNLLAWNIVRSSGSPLLDKAVEDMITAADPLPKVPVEFGGAADARSWEFVLPIDFRLLT